MLTKQAAAYARFSNPGQYVGWALTKVMAAVVANYRGRFADVISPIEQALAALVGEDTLPWQLPAQLLLARAHAALGRPDKADQVMAEAARHTGQHMAIYGPQVILANAWVAAARGGDKTAITLARKAAEAAHEAGQYAVEAEALHDAARFGDRAVSARLELAGRACAGNGRPSCTPATRPHWPIRRHRPRRGQRAVRTGRAAAVGGRRRRPGRPSRTTGTAAQAQRRIGRPGRPVGRTRRRVRHTGHRWRPPGRCRSVRGSARSPPSSVRG